MAKKNCHLGRAFYAFTVFINFDNFDFFLEAVFFLRTPFEQA